MKKVALALTGFLLTCNIFSQSIVRSGSGDSSAAQISKAAVIKSSFTIYPNPAKNKVTLQVSNFEAGMVNVSIFDNKGTQLHKDDRLLVNGNEEVTMFFSLQAGIYFIVLKQQKRIVKKKLVVI